MNDQAPLYDLPVSPAAEVALLGAVLRAGELPADVEALVLPEDFADPNRGEVYAAIVALVRKGKPCDHVAVMSTLDPTTLRAMNNGLLLAEFTEFAPVGGVEFHAEVVAATAERRRFLNAGLRIVQAAREQTDGLAELVRQTIDAVQRGGKHAQRPAWEVLAEIIDPQALPPGVPLGLPDLDDRINPLLPGSITAIGARSGVGKTTFVLDILRRAAYVRQVRSLMISIEMTDREVYTKLLSAEAVVDHTKILHGDPLDRMEERRVAEAVTRISNGSLYVADVDQLSLADFRALVREYKPDVVGLDFLGLCDFPNADRHDLAVAQFVYGVKRVSAQEQCHTVILSQFNRQADHRTDKRPAMGDFRDSSGLENAAHLALLLHRPDLFEEEERPGEVDVIVGKQRNGAAGFHVGLAAQLHYSRFTSLTRQAEPKWSSETLVDITEPTRRQEDPS